LSGGERSARRRFCFILHHKSLHENGSPIGKVVSRRSKNSVGRNFGNFVPNFRDWDSEWQKPQTTKQKGNTHEYINENI
jgi:hypothetical protein